MQKVSIVRCPDYELGRVKVALRESLDLLGGINRFVKPGQRVCVKVNLLAAAKPEQAVTTHPAVIEAMVNLVQEAGGKPFIADSPGAGIPHTQGGLRRVYQATGLLDLAERTGVELNWDTTVAQVSFPEGKLMKRLSIIKPVLDADVIIAMPKLKTHTFTIFTGATKILFGVVPGLNKPGYHANLANQEMFAEMLLDIIACIKPTLFVMDGVLAMEGNGPGLHGKPRQVGLLLASADPVAMDVTACQVIGVDSEKIPMLRAAKARGWWDGSLQNIEVLGCHIKEVSIPDFELPQTMRRSADFEDINLFQRLMLRVLRFVGVGTALTLCVVPQRNKCTACGTCMQSCPQKAITIVDKLAVVNDDQCIRCYCCHELCPQAAIELKYSWLGRLICRSGALGTPMKSA